jgi:hypothetical protein
MDQDQRYRRRQKLLEQDAEIGNRLNTVNVAQDASLARYLIRARRAVRSELEQLRSAE